MSISNGLNRPQEFNWSAEDADSVSKGIITASRIKEKQAVIGELNTLDLLHNQPSVNFTVLLSRFSMDFLGVVSTYRILPPKNQSKTRPK
jgi:hypothetical protein